LAAGLAAGLRACFAATFRAGFAVTLLEVFAAGFAAGFAAILLEAFDAAFTGAFEATLTVGFADDLVIGFKGCLDLSFTAGLVFLTALVVMVGVSLGLDFFVEVLLSDAERKRPDSKLPRFLLVPDPSTFLATINLSMPPPNRQLALRALLRPMSSSP
jgi:hypothetical protein